jgi:uncharacterized membrane protein
MMKKSSVRALVIASGISFPSLLALALPGAAHADLTLCNNSGEMVRVAVGYSAADGPVSGGWWTFDPNECGRLVSDDQVVDRTTYWVYAEQLDGGGTWEGDMRMCTTRQKSPFTIHLAGCADRGFVVHNFSEVAAPHGNVTTHLRSSGGRGNIDDNS